jgi:hypothetical protein
MLFAPDVCVGTKYGSESIQFGFTQTAARTCDIADRTVILDQQVILAVRTPFAHVSLAIS